MQTMLSTLIQDLHFAVRQLRRSPAFAFVAIATLALAIGVSTAIFSVLDATIVRPLPFNNPDSILVLRTSSPQGYGQPASWAQYLDWRRDNTSFTALAGYFPGSANLESDSGATPIRTVEGTDNFFDVFAVQPYLGRTFRPGEDQPGHNEVVVLSYELWLQTFGGNKNIIGTSVRVDGTPSTVIGVMPAGFRYPLSVTNALYRPMHLATSSPASTPRSSNASALSPVSPTQASSTSCPFRITAPTPTCTSSASPRSLPAKSASRKYAP